MTWDVTRGSKAETPGVVHLGLRHDGETMSWRDVLHGWSTSASFVDFFSSLLTSEPFEAIRWETPALVSGRLDQPFECVLIADDRLTRHADPSSFEQHFAEPGGVVRFLNLGRDCELVVPSPTQLHDDDYAHLTAFLRTASASQVHELWRTVAAAVFDRVDDVPLWLSTAGAGVPWLHVRLDARPKYYAYRPYREAPPA